MRTFLSMIECKNPIKHHWSAPEGRVFRLVLIGPQFSRSWFAPLWTVKHRTVNLCENTMWRLWSNISHDKMVVLFRSWACVSFFLLSSTSVPCCFSPFLTATIWKQGNEVCVSHTASSRALSMLPLSIFHLALKLGKCKRRQWGSREALHCLFLLLLKPSTVIFSHFSRVQLLS